jgi:hypothetical protein
MPNPAAENRYRLYRVPEDAVLQWFDAACGHLPEYVVLPRAIGLPADATVVGAVTDWVTRSFLFRVASREFGSVPDGEEIPRVDVFLGGQTVAVANPDDVRPLVVGGDDNEIPF